VNVRLPSPPVEDLNPSKKSSYVYDRWNRFFVDRSLGRNAVPEALRADGWNIVTLATTTEFLPTSK
jgi:hypothetical protein